MEFKTIKGFKDILPQEAGNWQRLESVARNVFELFGYQEIKTPILERTELFGRSIGEDTDIVSKEMYTLQDSKGRGMTMRPEATTSVVRAYIQHRLHEKNPVQKLFSIGPMFRHERPQKGRYRQFYQVNAELFGDKGPRSDADIIAMTVYLLESIGLKGLGLNLNSLGCSDCRPPFKKKLREYLTKKTDLFCADCRRRAETNPLRVFDCKMEGCKAAISDAPSILASLCNACRVHFEALQDYLSRSNIPYILNHKLVRGLDYYNRTTFEIQTDRLGSQNALLGGGRYDGLVKLLGGPDHPAIGFALGAERVITLMEEDNPSESQHPDLFIAALGEPAEKSCFNWALELRKSGFRVEMDYGSKGLKAQMKRADRLGAKCVLIVGDDEMKTKKGVLRDMDTKVQLDVDLEILIEELKRNL